MLDKEHKGGFEDIYSVGIVNFVTALLTFVGRQAAGAPSAQEWMRGALLSLGLIVILVIPFFKRNLLGGR